MKRRVMFIGLLVLAYALVVVGAAGAQSDDSSSAVLVRADTPRTVLPGDAPGTQNTAGAVAASPGTVWVAQHRAGEVDRIDANTGRVVARVRVPVPGCTDQGCLGIDSLVADARGVWVVNPDQQSLVHIDARRNKVDGTVPTIGFVSSPVLDGTSVWAVLSPSGDLVRIDSRTHQVDATVHLGVSNVAPLAIVDGALWVSSYDATAAPDHAAMLHRIDRRRAKETARVPAGVGATAAIAVGHDLWLMGCPGSTRATARTACPTIRRVDGHTGMPIAELPIDGGEIFTAAQGDGTLFVRSSTGGPGPQWITTISTRDNGVVGRFPLGSISTLGEAGLAIVHGSLWIADWNSNSVYRVALPVSAETATVSQ